MGKLKILLTNLPILNIARFPIQIQPSRISVTVCDFTKICNARLRSIVNLKKIKPLKSLKKAIPSAVKVSMLVHIHTMLGAENQEKSLSSVADPYQKQTVLLESFHTHSRIVGIYKRDGEIPEGVRFRCFQV